MAIGYSTTVRTARLQAVADAINGGAGAGVLRFYDGTRPATGGTVTNLLAEVTLADPVHESNSGGVLTLDFNPDLQDASANASGTATWARITDSTGTFVMDLSVTASGGGGDIELSTNVLVAGGVVLITAGTITAGNA
jgi:hypothetical protein